MNSFLTSATNVKIEIDGDFQELYMKYEQLILDNKYDTIKTPKYESNVLYLYNLVNVEIFSYPIKIESIIIKNCSIKYIEEIPKNVFHLEITNSHIEKLPKLPEKLLRLICSNNKIKELPELPNNLEYLECYNNEIKLLPKLPKNLTIIKCDKDIKNFDYISKEIKIN